MSMYKVFALSFLLFSCSHIVTVPLAPGEDRLKHQQVGEQAAIATQGPYASAAAQMILSMGGNLVDAAVASSFVISVERPQSTGLGGGGFLLYYKPGMLQPVSFDFREQAPLKAHSKMYLDAKGNEIPKLSLDGSMAVGVPGLVAGLFEFHRQYGKLDWDLVLGPAIDLAEHGFEVYPELAEAIKDRQSVLAQFPDSKKIFLNKEGKALVQGD